MGNKLIKKTQQGIALVSVLITVAIVSAISATLVSSLQKDISQASIALQRNNVLLGALAAEQIAYSLLASDEVQNKRTGRYTDSLNEKWNKEVVVTKENNSSKNNPTSTSTTLRLIDLQGRYNINNLRFYAASNFKTTQNNSLETDLSKYQQGLFKRLIINSSPKDDQSFDITISSSQAEEMLLALLDWFDEDSTTRYHNSSAGAEDLFYSSSSGLARQTSGANLANCRELRLIRYFDQTEIKKSIDRFITEFCVAHQIITPININTASAELLRSLHDELNTSNNVVVNNIIQQRKSASISVSQFHQMLATNLPLLSGKDALDLTKNIRLWQREIPARFLSSKSNFFMMIANIQIGVSRVKAFAVIQRVNEQDIRTISRAIVTI